MCISAEASERWMVTKARPCPRVELDPDNIEAWRLIEWTADDDLKSLAPLFAESLLDRYDAEARTRILQRAASALKSSEIRRLLHPHTED